MQRWIDPRRLLDVANQLAEVGAGPGQPRDAALRRAVSTAYYAAFHAVALAVADALLPGAPDQERWGLARYVSHGSIKNVCGWVSGATAPQHLRPVVARIRGDVGVTSAATLYTELLSSREAADYDHTAEFSHPSTLEAVRSAEHLVEVLLTRPMSEEVAALLGLVALQTSVR